MNKHLCSRTQSAGAIEYTDYRPADKCPEYDIEQSDGEASVML